MEYVKKLLLPDEEILFRTRLHTLRLAAYVSKEILVFLCLVAGFVATRWVPDPTWALYLRLAIAGVSMIVAGSALLDVLKWRSTQFIVTTRRVISCKGLLSKHVLDSSLAKINDVLLRQSWLGRILNYGTVEILTASDSAINVMEGIASPIGFKQALLKAKAAYEPMPSPTSAPPQPQRAVSAQLEELGDLRARGLITDAEYQEKRAEILRRM